MLQLIIVILISFTMFLDSADCQVVVNPKAGSTTKAVIYTGRQAATSKPKSDVTVKTAAIYVAPKTTISNYKPWAVTTTTAKPKSQPTNLKSVVAAKAMTTKVAATKSANVTTVIKTLANTNTCENSYSPSIRMNTYLSEMKNLMGKLENILGMLSLRLLAQQNKTTIDPGDANVIRTTITFLPTVFKKFYLYREPELTYDEAWTWCKERGLSLLSIETKQTNDALAEILETEDYPIKEKPFWTSGNDLQRSRAFIWKSTGSSFKYTQFFKLRGEPDNVGGKEHCVAAEYKYDTVQWRDEDCEIRKQFICE